MTSMLPWAPFSTDGVVGARRRWGTCYTRSSDATCTRSDGAVIALGAFDGLHKGHKDLVRHALADARERGVPCAIVTFDPDPVEVVGDGGGGNRLLCVPDRCAGLLSLGVDCVYAVSFTTSLSKLLPDDFIQFLAGEVVRPCSVHVGTNFRFGHKGQGDVELLAKAGQHEGFDVRIHRLVEDDGSSISATRIRSLLHTAHLHEANLLLERCHYVRGTVAHGRGEGTSFGFPTANVVCDTRDCLPCEGVYGCYVIYGSRSWAAAVNVGAPPTFSSPQPAFLEANLIDFTGDLYGQEVSVAFVHWLRPSRPFDSLEELERVVMGNIQWVRENMSSTCRG